MLAVLTKADKLTRSGLPVRALRAGRGTRLAAGSGRGHQQPFQAGYFGARHQHRRRRRKGEPVRSHWYSALLILGCTVPVRGRPQSAQPVPVTTTVSYGTLNQNDLALRMRNEELEIRFVPLDPKITPLLANDAFQSLRSLVESRRPADRLGRLPGRSDEAGSGAGEFLRTPGRHPVRSPDPHGPVSGTARFSRSASFRSIRSSHRISWICGSRPARSTCSRRTMPVDDSFTLSYGATDLGRLAGQAVDARSGAGAG